MTRRARSLAVMATLLGGALALIASTQQWLAVTLNEGSGDPLPVPGADAVLVLAPLSLAVLALGAALSIVGVVLRYVFGALTLVIGVTLAWLSGVVAFTRPTSAVAGIVTEATGITGADAVSGLVADVTVTPWPFIAVACGALLVAAAAFTLATARGWRSTGRRYETEGASAAPASASAPLDSVDSWDDLSRGDDPTR